MKKNSFWQFISYFFVGGIAAIVEWIAFFVFNSILVLAPLIATCLAFVFSTFVNWILGRLITFKDSVTNTSKVMDALKIYGVSALGLLWNLILMYIFTSVFTLWPLGSKIAATGIVFIWNYFIRKLWIYKK